MALIISTEFLGKKGSISPKLSQILVHRKLQLFNTYGTVSPGSCFQTYSYRLHLNQVIIEEKRKRNTNSLKTRGVKNSAVNLKDHLFFMTPEH